MCCTHRANAGYFGEGFGVCATGLSKCAMYPQILRRVRRPRVELNTARGGPLPDKPPGRKNEGIRKDSI
jgi:hypothetical protein